MLLNLANPEESEIKFKTSKFPGGEIHLRLEHDLYQYGTSGSVRIVCRLNSSDDLIRLCLAVDALRRERFDWIEAHIPYIPYARQDRKCNPGEAHALKVFSSTLNSLKLNRVICYDPHSDVCEALIDNLEIQTNENLIDWAITEINKVNPLTHLNVLSPDAGQSKKIYKVLKDYRQAFLTVYECSKIRDLKTTNIIGVNVPLIENDDPILTIDDICDGGRTFIEIAKKLREHGQQNEVYLCVSHGIFSHGEVELAKYFKHIYTTNSIRDFDYVENKEGGEFSPTQVESKLISRMRVI